MVTLFGLIITFMKISPAFSSTGIGCFSKEAIKFYDNDMHERNGWEPNKATIEYCTSICRSAFPKFRYAALKDGQECYCGDVFDNTKPSYDCNVPCKGDIHEYCGGNTSFFLHTVCPNGTYIDHAAECTGMCRCLNKAKPCHQAIGDCFGGECEKNFTGPSCNKCIPGNWGQDCSNPCSQCKNGPCKSDCDCDCELEDCQPGYHGKKCDLKCSDCTNKKCANVCSRAVVFTIFDPLIFSLGLAFSLQIMENV